MHHPANGSAVWRNIFSGKSLLGGSTESVLSGVPAFAHLSARELRGVAAIVHKVGKELSKIHHELDPIHSHRERSESLSSEDHHGKVETTTAGPGIEASKSHERSPSLPD